MASQKAEFSALAATARFPALAGVLSELDEGFELDFDEIFELGLRSLLDGFAEVIARALKIGVPVSRAGALQL